MREKGELKKLITVPEAARLRACSPEAIRALINRGRLRSVALFGKRLVYRHEVLEFKKGKPGPKK